jgi:hypothetical protein
MSKPTTYLLSFFTYFRKWYLGGVINKVNGELEEGLGGREDRQPLSQGVRRSYQGLRERLETECRELRK